MTSIETALEQLRSALANSAQQGEWNEDAKGAVLAVEAAARAYVAELDGDELDGHPGGLA